MSHSLNDDDESHSFFLDLCIIEIRTLSHACAADMHIIVSRIRNEFH